MASGKSRLAGWLGYSLGNPVKWRVVATTQDTILVIGWTTTNPLVLGGNGKKNVGAAGG